jgi:hypothetical protein
VCYLVLLATIRPAALSRRAAALRSYRSSLSSSGKALLMASAARAGSDEGRFGGGGIGIGKSQGTPRTIDFRIRLKSRDVPSTSGVSSAPNSAIRRISEVLIRRICVRSSWACATEQAWSRTMASAPAPAILRANFSDLLGASGRGYGKAVAAGVTACPSLPCGRARTGTLYRVSTVRCDLPFSCHR